MERPQVLSRQSIQSHNHNLQFSQARRWEAITWKLPFCLGHAQLSVLRRAHRKDGAHGGESNSEVLTTGHLGGKRMGEEKGGRVGVT